MTKTKKAITPKKAAGSSEFCEGMTSAGGEVGTSMITELVNVSWIERKYRMRGLSIKLHEYPIQLDLAVTSVQRAQRGV